MDTPYLEIQEKRVRVCSVRSAPWVWMSKLPQAQAFWGGNKKLV